jgi:hypothetical protein
MADVMDSSFDESMLQLGSMISVMTVQYTPRFDAHWRAACGFSPREACS